MAQFKDIKDEVTRLELAKRLYGEGIKWYGGDVSDKTLIDYSQELADNVFEDSSINWIGNGELEYDAGDSSVARMTRNDASINYSGGYFDIPIPITQNCRIETSIYIPSFYTDYHVVNDFSSSYWNRYVNQIGENTWAAYGFRYAEYRNESLGTYSSVTVPIKVDGTFNNYGIPQYYCTLVQTDTSDVWKSSAMGYSSPLSFPFATVFMGHSGGSWSDHEGYEVSTSGPGLGFADGFYWLKGAGKSKYGYTDNDDVVYPEYATDMCFANSTNVINRFSDISITFKGQDSSVYMDMFMDHDGYATRSFPDGHVVTTSIKHAYKPLGAFEYGTYNMRIFGSIDYERGSWKGFRFKEFRVYDGNNTLLMKLEPRIHFVAAVLRFQPCWYDTINDKYYLSTTDYRGMNYGW